MSNEERQAALKKWMDAHFITAKDLAEALGCSLSTTYMLLNRENLPQKRHNQLIKLGFPSDLLPPVLVKPAPIFPGLVPEESQALASN